jgi:hypothetical protein
MLMMRIKRMLRTINSGADSPPIGRRCLSMIQKLSSILLAGFIIIPFVPVCHFPQAATRIEYLPVSESLLRRQWLAFWIAVPAPPKEMPEFSISER